MVFVLGGTTVKSDKLVLDGTLYAMRHIVIEVGHTQRHLAQLVVAKVLTCSCCGWSLVGTDAGDKVLTRVDIATHLVAQTALVQGTLVTEAAQVGGCFFSEKCRLVFHIELVCWCKGSNYSLNKKENIRKVAYTIT